MTSENKTPGQTENIVNEKRNPGGALGGANAPSVREAQSEFVCPCGSTLKCKKSLYRHLRTKRHQRFEETGMIAPKTQAEYQKRYYNKHPEQRMKHRQLCQKYYQQNREAIREKQAQNGAMKRFREKKRDSLRSKDSLRPELPSVEGGTPRAPQETPWTRLRCSGCGRGDDFCRCGTEDSELWWG